MNPVTNNPTPLQKLISEKERVRNQCKQQEEKLSAQFGYFQNNAGSILVSGLSSLLFPKSKSSPAQANSDLQQKESEANQSIALGLSDYLSIAKSMMPALWDIARPILISWGIARARSVVMKLFHKK